MNVYERCKLLSNQQKLMYERNFYEQMQTDFSYDEDFYTFCVWKIHMLDEEAEQIRYVIEMGCCE